MYKKILVPLDGSEVADSVLPFVGNLARRLDASVTLFTAVAPGRSAASESETAVGLKRRLRPGGRRNT